MKTILPILFLFFCGVAGAQILNIPDAGFRNKLLQSNTTNTIAKNSSGASIKIDANNDGNIEQNEVNLVAELNVSGSNIFAMDGIAYFNNLEILNCEGNYISALNVSSLSNLETLYCGSNGLTTLNVTGLDNLRGLYFSNNAVASMSFSGLTGVRWLECNDNQFTTLNLTALTDLRELKCNDNYLTTFNIANLADLRLVECAANQLSALDLTGLVHLEELLCGQNQIATLNFTGLGYLRQADCSDNQLTQLDFSGNPYFNELDCSQNSITYINLKNGATQLYDSTTAPNNWSGNSGLAFICIDESEELAVNDIVAANGLTVNFNTYCTFVPGGVYNTIAGTMIFDGDNDGCDTGDVPQRFIKVGLSDGTTESAEVTNEAGGYAFQVGTGTFDLVSELENPAFFTLAPTSSQVTFPLLNGMVITNNICISPNGNHPDVEVVIQPLIPAVPGDIATYKLVYKNKGNQVLSGSVTFSCDESLITYTGVNPMADNIVPGTYTWDYTNLQPFENREIEIFLAINSPSDMVPVNVGDELVFSSVATSASGDNIPADNAFEFRQKAVASYIPNSITCIEGETESPDAIGDYLHYAVNFRNMGSEAATSIVVRYDVDPAQYDVKSLQVLNSSHAMRARVKGRKVEFIMQNANLAAADHGNILFKVKTKASLTAGAFVTSNARVFYDYKTPVQTSNATTVFETLSRGDFNNDNSVKLYPNPARNIVTISADGNVRSIEMYDIQGRLLETGTVNDSSTTIDLSARPSGMYFVKVYTEKGIKVEKLVRE